MASDTELTVTAGANPSRTVRLEVGKEYVIDPINPLKERNRGRRVKLLGFLSDGAGGKVAKVKFLDKGRSGRVELGDLNYIQDEEAA